MSKKGWIIVATVVVLIGLGFFLMNGYSKAKGEHQRLVNSFNAGLKKAIDSEKQAKSLIFKESQKGYLLKAQIPYKTLEQSSNSLQLTVDKYGKVEQSLQQVENWQSIFKPIMSKFPIEEKREEIEEKKEKLTFLANQLGTSQENLKKDASFAAILHSLAQHYKEYSNAALGNEV